MKLGFVVPHMIWDCAAGVDKVIEYVSRMSILFVFISESNLIV
jgi:hypothetical protein